MDAAKEAANQDNPREALRLAREALPLAQEAKFKVELRNWIHALEGEVAIDDARAAQADARKAREHQEYENALAASNAGNAAAKAGNYAQALEYYRTMLLNPRFASENNRKIVADIEARLGEQQAYANALAASKAGGVIGSG